MPVPLKARRDFPYAGHRVKQGQDFDARTANDARILKAIGHAEDRPAAAAQTYRTRMMTAEPPAQVVAPSPVVVAKTDSLDDMDAEALHALAESRGVYVHHRAGAERVRAAIRSAQKSEE